MANRFIFVIIFIIFSFGAVFSQTDTNRIDSNYSVAPIKSLGSISLLHIEKVYMNISKHTLPEINYSEFADILEANIPVFPLNLGAAGARNSFSAFGSMPSQIAIQFNSRPITDRKFFNINLNQLAPEFLEDIQILSGSEAVINENNSSGLLLNIKEPVYNTQYPYTKIWYSQGGDNLLSADGIYAQNIHPKLNFYFGFRSQSSQGAFANTSYDSWNIRTGLRYNHSELTSISLNHIFTNYKIGENGGINAENSSDIFDNISSSVNYYEFISQVFRHDINLTYASYLVEDSSSALSASLFFSNSDNENRRDSLMAFPNEDLHPNYSYNDIYYGGKVNYEISFYGIGIKSGIESFQYQSSAYKGLDSYSGNKTSAFASMNTKLIEKKNIDNGGKSFIENSLDFYAGYRFTNYRNSQYHNSGARISYKDKEIKFFTDLSFSQTLPNDFELELNKVENHFLALADLKYKLPIFTGSNPLFLVNAYYRLTKNPILYNPVFNSEGKVVNTYPVQAEKREAHGVTVAIFFDLFKNFNIKLWASYNNMDLDSINNLMPKLYAGADVSYLMTFGRSSVTLGADFNFKTSHSTYSFMPFNRSYYISDTEAKAMNNGINLYAIAKLGTAYVKATLYNLLSSDYYYVGINPMMTRNLRLSVHWAFLD